MVTMTLDQMIGAVKNNPKLGWYGVGTDDHTIPIRWFKSRKKAEAEAQEMANRDDRYYAVALCCGRSVKEWESTPVIGQFKPNHQAAMGQDDALDLIEALYSSSVNFSIGPKFKVRAAIDMTGKEAIVTVQSRDKETPAVFAKAVRSKLTGKWTRVRI